MSTTFTATGDAQASVSPSVLHADLLRKLHPAAVMMAVQYWHLRAMGVDLGAALRGHPLLRRLSACSSSVRWKQRICPRARALA